MTEPTPATPEQSATPEPQSVAPEQPSATAEQTVPAVPAEATVPAEGKTADPWSREAETVPVTAETPAVEPVAVSTIEPQTTAAPSDALPTAAFEGAPATEVVAKPRRRRTTLVLAIVAVVVVLLGAGAYAGARYWTGAGITEPESAVPASVVAFARIDVNPGVRDKLDFQSLIEKFPTHGKSAADVVTSVEKSVASSAKLDYTTDVKPWFAGQAGVAEWVDSAGKPVMLLAFASKDDAAAKKALAKVQAKQTAGQFGFVVSGGYALIAGADGNAQADATAASAAAAKHNLADSVAFTAAVKHLSGHNLFIAYADEHQIGSLMKSQLASAIGGANLLGDNGSDGTASAISSVTGMLGSQSTAFDSLKGTVIVGGSIVDNGVEIRVHTDGQTASSAVGTNVRPTLDAMPDTTIVGLAIDGADPNGATMKRLSPMLGSMLGGALGAGGSDDPTDPHATAPVDPSMVQALSGAITNLLTSKVISLAFTGLSGKMPSGYISLEPRDAAAEHTLATMFGQFTGGKPTPGIAITDANGHVQVTLGDPTSSGKLSSLSLYQKTMAGMSTSGSSVYVDVQKLVKLIEANGGHLSTDDEAQIAPIKSIGISATSGGSSSDGLIRIVITK